MKLQFLHDSNFAEIVSNVERIRRIKSVGHVAPFKNYDEAEKDFTENGIHLSDEQIRLSCVPNSSTARIAFMWLYNFINMVGDVAPNRHQLVHLPAIYTKKSIYHMYRAQVMALYSIEESDVYSMSSFMEMWTNIFPKVKITQYCQVCGKCFTCHWIYERQVSILICNISFHYYFSLI